MAFTFQMWADKLKINHFQPCQCQRNLEGKDDNHVNLSFCNTQRFSWLAAYLPSFIHVQTKFVRWRVYMGKVFCVPTVQDIILIDIWVPYVNERDFICLMHMKISRLNYVTFVLVFSFYNFQFVYFWNCSITCIWKALVIFYI